MNGALAVAEVAEPEPSVVPQREDRQSSLSNLRAFVILTVVVLHVALVYSTMKPPLLAAFTDEPRYWLMFPIADSAGWLGFTLFFVWHDIAFMPLMFLLSGLFVWSSLRRRGAGEFIKHRFLRLGVPFLLMALLGPLTYYPAYLQIGVNPDFGSFLKTWLSLGNWPAGPSWFLWVLLTLDCLATLSFLAFPRAVEAFGKWLGQAGEKPILFYSVVVALTQLAYVPLLLLLGMYGAVMFGPFFAQGTKLLVYLLYFFVGVGLGVFGSDAGLFARTGRLARQWALWGVASLVLFGASMGASFAAPGWVSALIYPFSCAATGLLAIAAFVRFPFRNRIVDNFAANAYGIFALHYIFLTWVQWMLVPIGAPAVVKAIIALTGAVALSWGATALLRRSRTIAQVI